MKLKREDNIFNHAMKDTNNHFSAACAMNTSINCKIPNFKKILNFY
jgi:hypothetical protein